MDANQALKFAFDWPQIVFLPAICNTCGRQVQKKRTLQHMNEYHPGWLEEWNGALRANGIDQ